MQTLYLLKNIYITGLSFCFHLACLCVCVSTWQNVFLEASNVVRTTTEAFFNALAISCLHIHLFISMFILWKYRQIWIHGNVLIVPTFTPDIVYTVGVIGQSGLIRPVNQWHNVTFCLSGPSLSDSPISPAHSSIIFTPHDYRWPRSQRMWRFCQRSTSISSILVFLSYPIDTTYKNGPSLPELQTSPPLFYFSPTCFYWGLITWWTE